MRKEKARGKEKDLGHEGRGGIKMIKSEEVDENRRKWRERTWGEGKES